jgi:soluble lytic murein transglycosylase
LTKKSQPKACDPLFKVWQEAGQRTPEKIWQRLALAASKGDHTLIPYLKRISPKKDRYLADLWYKVRRNPHTVSRLKYFPNADIREKEILLYGVKRLVWRDSKAALNAWENIQERYEFSPQEKTDVAKTFAIRLAKAGDVKAQIWLEKIPADLMTDDVVQWRIADSLRRNDWQDALGVLQSLPPQLAEEEAWSYWLARSLNQTGAQKDAQLFFEKVAKERHYYGFLAATLIGQPPNLADDPLEFSDAQLQLIDDKPAAQRALEFRHLNRYAQARREWNYFNRKLNRQEKLAAAKWANQNAWYDRAIFTLAEQKYWDDVNLRFPLAYKDTLSFHSNRNQLEPSLIFAIARRESSFMSDAYSSAGAYGLMQMLPSTAKFIAKKKVHRSKLFDSDTNVQYGTDYLKYLLKNVKGNEVIAAAAYNAGITRVRRWLKTEQPMPADIWIETIPFKETREYVKSVMAYRQIYSELLGNSENKFKTLTDMQIGL